MTSPNVTHVNETNYDKEVLQSDKLVLIDFYADWCGPCKSMSPLIEKFAEENKDIVKVVKVNVDESQHLASDFNIRSIPTLITMKDGVAIFGGVGGMKKSEIEKLVSDSFKHLAVIAAQGIKPSQPNV